MRREAYLVNEIILRTERERAMGTWTGMDDDIMDRIRRRANLGSGNNGAVGGGGGELGTEDPFKQLESSVV